MMKTEKNIPALRFPEFEGEWGKVKLEQITNRIGDGLHGTPEYVEDGNCFFINGNNLVNGKININEQTKMVSQNSLDFHQKGLNEETILISINGTIGSLARYNQENVMLGKSVGYFIFREESEFFFHHLSTEKIQRHFFNELTGTTIKNLSLKTLRETIVGFPSLPEQQKIASFLSSVDQRIHLLTQKKEKLEQYKKGLMQRIFSQELRFKPALSEVEGDENGKDYPEWKYLKANTLFKNHTNKNHNGDLPILSASQEHGMILREDGGIKIQSSDKSVLSYKIVEKGDFVISLRSFQGGIDYSSIKGICSPAYTVLKNISAIYPVFYRYFFKKESFIKRLNIAVIGIRDGKQISFETFGDLKLPYPNIAEQQKIATFLSSLDDRITQVSTQLHLARKWKQGLLQKMFV